MIDITRAEFINICNLDPGKNLSFSGFGLVDSDLHCCLTYATSKGFFDQANKNPNISIILAQKDIFKENEVINSKQVIPCSNPDFVFAQLFNNIVRKKYKIFPNRIDHNTNIHPSASIADNNIIIGPNVEIGPNAVILENTVLTSNIFVGSGSIIGSTGLSFIKYNDKIIDLFHDGQLVVDDNVSIGTGSVLCKGISISGDTVIGSGCRIDNLVHVSHSVQIGKNTNIAARSVICGSVKIGSNAWIGPGSIISNKVFIGSDVYISIGSVVVEAVPDGAKVTGNFALPHELFLSNIKNIYSRRESSI
ncbi:MAG: hypothetical protein ACOC3T_02985 [Bacteroidota bacterium]